MATHATRATTGTTADARNSAGDDHAAQETWLGTDHRWHKSNVSWGAVVAGVVTFVAVSALLSLVTVGIGLTGAGVAAGIWSIIAVAIALFAGAWVAGALAVRSGLLHGFLTWATSLVAGLALTAWIGASALGAVGNALTSVADDALTGTDVTQITEEIDSEDLPDEQSVDEARDTAQATAWWSFAGLLIGAGISALGGALGVRTVIARTENDHAHTTTR